MSNFKIRRQVIADMEKDGRVTARRLVDAARDKRHPLHNDFDWNDKIAADKYRLDQARDIISSVKVIVTNDTKRFSTVYYVRDPSVGNKQGYISVAKLQTETELAYQVLQQEAERITSCVERARQFAAAVNLESELEDILRAIARIKSAPRRGNEGEARPAA